MQRLGEGYFDSYNIVISPTGVEPPPNGNGEPPPPPPDSKWGILAVLAVAALVLVSGKRK